MPNTIPYKKLPQEKVSYTEPAYMNIKGGGQMPRSSVQAFQTAGDIPPWFREGMGSAKPNTPEHELDRAVQQLQMSSGTSSRSGMNVYQRIQVTRSNLNQIDRMVAGRRLSPEQGEAAKWKIVLPKEAEAAMFPGGGAGAMAYMPSTLKGLEEDLQTNYVKGDAPWYKGGFGRDVKSQTKVMDVYKQWQSDRGYWHPSMGQYRRAQLDELFDANASDMTNWDWDPTSGEVRASRTSQRSGLTGAASRMIDTTRRIPGKSPMAEQVIQSKEDMDRARMADLLRRQ